MVRHEPFWRITVHSDDADIENEQHDYDGEPSIEQIKYCTQGRKWSMWIHQHNRIRNVTKEMHEVIELHEQEQNENSVA